MAETLIEVRDLKKHFPVTKGLVLMKQVGAIKAVDGIDFTINRGETFGLVGESGCGKTTTAKLVLLLEKVTSGAILYQGRDITHLSGPELKRHRGLVQAIFQDPYSSLSPRMRVGGILSQRSVPELARGFEAFIAAAGALGVTELPMGLLTSLPLPVVPRFRPTDMGLVDVEKQEIVPAWGS